jgi:hypothetical protein
MKLRSGGISAIAAGVLAVSALTGVTGAMPASAMTYTYLCISGQPEDGGGCLDAGTVGNPAHMSEASVATTNWLYPNTNFAVGGIRQANTQLCLQIAPDGITGGGATGLTQQETDNIVRMAACNGDLAEMWENIYNTGSKATEFINIWALDNESGTICLEESEVGFVFVLDCNDSGYWVS